MRIIKFRVWDAATKELLSNLSLDIVGNFYLSRNNDRYILQQFTGGFDKNKRELYEGDIVKVYEDKILQIKWNEETLGFNFAGANGFCLGHTGYRLASTRPDHYEIIGNIHENPELLK